jgi:DNA polymerase-3 subunit epsilon
VIHTLLKLTRPLVSIDCEATSTDPQTARIIEIAFVMFYPDERPAKEWSMRVNPGVPIPAASTAVHHITDADVADRPTFKQLAANLAKGFTDCDYCGQNCRYDLRLISAEMQRCGQPWSYVGAKIIDSYQLERLAVPRSLSHLYRKYAGEDLKDVHGAMADVKAANIVIAKQLERYSELPRDLEKLHEMQWPGELDEGGKFKMIDGVATCQFGKWRGKAMREIPVSYYDWLLKSDFPADVKTLAGQAKLGNYLGDAK